MIQAIEQELTRMGYAVNRQPYAIIQECDDWYRARETAAHRQTTVNGVTYTVDRMGFGRRLASDDATLCEVVEINAGGNNQAQYEFVNNVLKDNRFDTQYRRQLELMAAEGTAACYVWLENGERYTDGSLRGGRIRLGYVDAMGFVPLTVENGDVLDAAFVGEDFRDGKKTYRLVVCARDRKGVYAYHVRAYDEQGKEIPGERSDSRLGTVRPFAVLKTANVNSFDDMDGFGFPKLYDVIPILRALDMAFTALRGDVDSAEKITLINEALCGFDDTGRPLTPNEQMKRRFVMLGEKLPQDSDLVHEIVPEIRVDKFREVIELLMNLASQQFGFGTKKYVMTDDNRLQTATQYIGEKQDMLQELNRQHFEAKEYIAGIVRAVLWFANIYQGAAWDENADVLVEFDDSYITNRAQELEDMRADALSGIGGAYVRTQYLMARYNLDEAEAAKWARQTDIDAGEETED